MSGDVEMEVLPSFIDNECKIVFSFRFLQNQKKVGEVTIITCLGKLTNREDRLNTVAYCCNCSILEKYRESSINKLMQFLNAIGIKRLNYKKHKKADQIGQLQH